MKKKIYFYFLQKMSTFDISFPNNKEPLFPSPFFPFFFFYLQCFQQYQENIINHSKTHYNWDKKGKKKRGKKRVGC